MSKRRSNIYLAIFIIGSLFITPALAYKTDVHEVISLHASMKSDKLREAMIDVGLLNLDQPVNESMLFSKSLSEWIQHGSVWEDMMSVLVHDPLLPDGVLFNHFYNPLNNQGYTNDSGEVKGQSLIERFHDGYNDWSYAMLKKLYYTALTGDTSAIVKNKMWDGLSWLGTPIDHGVNINHEGREQFFAWTLQALGHTLHLIQDASVPAHTRNDLHGYAIPPFYLPPSGREPFEKWTNENLDTLKDYNYYSKPGSDPWTYWKEYPSYIPSLHTFIDTNQLDEASASPIVGDNQGLAEYSHANFVSHDTIGKFNLPIIPHRNAWVRDYADGNYTLEEKSTFFGKKLTFVYLKNESIGVDYFLLSGVFHNNLQEPWPTTTHEYDVRYTVNDDLVSKDYAAKLIPRAVGYSTGFLDYFFRGSLEITPPDQYVYAVIDGSEIVQPDNTQYIYTLKAKVKNSTPDEEMLDGTLVAVAKYKRYGYQPDLSSGAPTIGMREENFSYSRSAEIDILSLSSTTPEKFTFDFTDNPIPAGITDLYLQVIFKGTIGNEEEQAIAVGMKDLNEPQHVVFWNDTDYFQYNGIPHTAEEMRRDHPAIEAIAYIDPFTFTETIGFSRHYPDTAPAPKVEIPDLPPARYSRIIVITDGDDASYYLTDNVTAYYPPNAPGLGIPDVDATWKYSLPTAIHQGITQEDWVSTSVYRVRGVVQHQRTYFMNASPYLTYINSLPEPPENVLGPYQETFILSE